MEVLTRQIGFSLYDEMKDTNRIGELLGLDSANLYYCSNYAVPLHLDRDIGIGLCLNLELNVANSDDFAFIYMMYGIYFEPRENSLWYIPFLLPFMLLIQLYLCTQVISQH